MPLEAEQVCPITHTRWVRLSEHRVVPYLSLWSGTLKDTPSFMKCMANLPSRWSLSRPARFPGAFKHNWRTSPHEQYSAKDCSVSAVLHDSVRGISAMQGIRLWSDLRRRLSARSQDRSASQNPNRIDRDSDNGRQDFGCHVGARNGDRNQLWTGCSSPDRNRA